MNIQVVGDLEAALPLDPEAELPLNLPPPKPWLVAVASA